MPAQIPDSIADWSTTAGSNQPSSSANVGPDLDDNLRAMQVAVRQIYTRGSIASAATCDIGTVDAELITITGTTTITSLGATLGASGYGVHKVLTFAGALTLTNSASLACITSANITTAAGDSCMVEYGASGWTMLWYSRKSSMLPATLVSGKFLTNNGSTISWGDATVKLSSLGAADAANTLANGAWKQTWGWSNLGVSDVAFELSGTSASSYGTLLRLSGSCQYLIDAVTASCSRFFSLEPSGGVVIGQGTVIGAGNGTSITIRGNSPAASSNGNGGSVSIYAAPKDGSGTDGSVTVGSASSGAAARANFATSGATLAGNTKLVLDQKHVFVDNTNGSPTISAGGGTGATIAGSDVLFEVTFGTGSPTSVTVTFANAWASEPLVLVSGTQSGQVLHYSAATNTVQILSSAAFSSGTKVSVLCIGKQ